MIYLVIVSAVSARARAAPRRRQRAEALLISPNLNFVIYIGLLLSSVIYCFFDASVNSAAA